MSTTTVEVETDRDSGVTRHASAGDTLLETENVSILPMPWNFTGFTHYPDVSGRKHR